MIVALLSLVACENKNEPAPKDPEQLATPVLTVDSVGETSAHLSWTSIENATSYSIVLNNETTNLITTNITANLIEITDLTPSTYTFRVRAYNDDTDNFVASEWAETSFEIEQVQKPEPEDLTIGINITNVTETEATIVVTPNQNDTWFFARVITVAELKTFDIYQYDEDIIMYMMENPDREDYIFKGEQTIEMERLQPSYEYMVVAFDYLNPGKLFKEEFKTKDAQLEKVIEISNLEVGYTDVSFTVTPSDNNEYWYYEWMTTESYESYGKNVIIHAYYGLQNLALSYGFNNIGEYLKVVAMSGEDEAYITGLHNETDYTVMVFYVNPNSTDPTQIYDWNYTPVSFTTLTPTGDGTPTIDIVDTEVISRGNGVYDMNVTVKVNDAVTSLSAAATTYESCAAYYDQGWEAIKAFFWLRDLGTDALTMAKSEDGYVYSKYGLEAGDYVFLFEGSNAEGVMVYNGARFDPTRFE